MLCSDSPLCHLCGRPQGTGRRRGILTVHSCDASLVEFDSFDVHACRALLWRQVSSPMHHAWLRMHPQGWLSRLPASRFSPTASLSTLHAIPSMLKTAALHFLVSSELLHPPLRCSRAGQGLSSHARMYALLPCEKTPVQSASAVPCRCGGHAARYATALLHSSVLCSASTTPDVL